MAHTITATARDAAGDTSTSAIVTVTVSNQTSSTPDDQQAPSAPTNLNVGLFSHREVALRWRAAIDNIVNLQLLSLKTVFTLLVFLLVNCFKKLTNRFWRSNVIRTVE